MSLFIYFASRAVKLKTGIIVQYLLQLQDFAQL